MDRFYAWASKLQVEHRDLKQRVAFLESNISSFNSTKEEDELNARLKAVTFRQAS
jgi:hypothetical protein